MKFDICECTFTSRTDEPPCFEIGHAARFFTLQHSILIRCMQRGQDWCNGVTGPPSTSCNGTTKVIKPPCLIYKKFFLHSGSMVDQCDICSHNLLEPYILRSSTNYQ